MKRTTALLVAFCIVFFPATGTASSNSEAKDADYRSHPAFADFVARMQTEHDFPAAELEKLFTGVTRQQAILDAISSPAEGKDWSEYRPIFLTDARIDAGVTFWNEHADLLARAERKFGVDREIIIAIIGVETFYGRHTGTWRVLDALATLGFDYPPRSSFFTSQLEHFMLLVREEAIDVREVTGSYAGAMGGGQFIPSSYRQYAVDFDGDGRRDLWQSWPDIIGSVANYLSRFGWKHRDVIAIPAAASTGADLPDEQGMIQASAAELRKRGLVFSRDIAADTTLKLVTLQHEDDVSYWLGLNNFGVINRYNRSPLYAMAVIDLAREIVERRTGQQAGQRNNEQKTN